MGRLGNNPSSRGYATPTYATTTLTARETFGGTSKAGLGRHIGMGPFTYSAIINASSGHQASFLAGNSFPAAFSAGRLLDKQYPISKTNQLARVGTGTTGGMTRTPADGVNTQQREKMQERVDKWNDVWPSLPIRDTPNDCCKTIPYLNQDDGHANTIANEQLYGDYPDSTPLPNIITADTFDQYFIVDKGIENCKNGTGCPDNAQTYITGPGIIEWKGGQSATFRTRNPVLPSGYGFLGFKLNSVPGESSGLWNAIWLMGKDNCGPPCTSGSLLEIDIYEMNTGWNWSAPKLSFHDWQDGHGTTNKDGNDGCFGVYLNGPIGDGNCSQTYGEKIKDWDWNSAQSKIYNGATWYTLITKQPDGKPLAYIGISLNNSWLPQNKQEATLQNVINNSDFLISSGEGNIDGNPAGGYYFCISSTATSPPPDGQKYDIPSIVNYDGDNSGS